MSVSSASAWWRSAAIYQVYPRSFADSGGDGVGDIGGIRSRLPHLAELGVDAVWISPWYRSPMCDGGYDVADYRDIDPLFGTLADAEALIADAHALGIRVIVDIVPNHCSDQHPWFQAALAAGPGSAERDLFLFRDGRGPDGGLPPNDWPSAFGGPGWRRVTEPDGQPGQWYFHRFAPGQPDFNWEHPSVREEFRDILRFWLDRGVDGFRIDVADNLVKDQAFPDLASLPEGHSPFSDQEGVHEVYRGWREVLDSYEGDRIFVGEIWNPDPERFARYLRPDELNTAFNFPFLQAAWDAGALREVIDATLAEHAPVGAPATWVLCNHDTTRAVTRYGRADTRYAPDWVRIHNAPVDLALGTRRARAAALLTMALPGCVYIYQGDELGLWEVEDIPAALRQDPTYAQSGGTDPGRDGCRVPIPWSGEAPPFGFSPEGSDHTPWLPQPAAWKEHTAAVQAQDPDSMLTLYRRALSIRRTEQALRAEPMAWLPADPDQVLAFTRGDLTCLVNFSGTPTPLPHHRELLLASGPLDGDAVPPDTTVWLRTG